MRKFKGRDSAIVCLSFYSRMVVKSPFSGCRTVSSGISGASYYTGTLNTVNRSPAGDYVAVVSRGNFFLTWEPGQVSKFFFLLFIILNLIIKI